jgi:hypothetical protein
MRLAAAALAVVLGTLVALAQQTTTSDTRLLPPDGLPPGWKKSGPQRVFTSADLYGHINGGAETFLELGFERLTVQRYEGAAGALAVELYRMSDATAARGVYLARRGKESRDPALPERHTANQYQLLLQRERFFLIVNNLAGGAATAPVMIRAAAAAVAQLPRDVPVKELEALPATGLVGGSERILRGPFGLQAIYTLGDGDMLQLGGRVTAVSGNYAGMAAGPYTLIVATYPSASAATAAFRYIRSHLDPLLKPTSTQATRLVFQDYERKYGIVNVSGTRIEITVHLQQAIDPREVAR